MPKLPEFMLRALYVKGSLSNQDNNFEFQMKNELGPALIVGAQALQLDRKPVPLDQCRFVHGGLEANFRDVSPEQSVLMRKGEAITVLVEGMTLKAGRHTLGISVTVKDMGSISFSVSDQVQ